MKKPLFILGAFTAFWIALSPLPAKAINIDVNFISGYYGVPEPTVVAYEGRLHDWQDAATLFYLSKLSGTNPQIILGWRVGGTPWVMIAQRLRLSPSVFYVPSGDEDDYFAYHQGPPYGNAWGYWRHHGRGRTLVLTDAAVRNRVMLVTTSRYYGIPVENEIANVGRDRDFHTVIIREEEGGKHHGGFGESRGKHRGRENNGGNNQGDQGNGKRHGNHGDHGNDHGRGGD